MVWRRIHAERLRGRAFQPRFAPHHVLASWLGGLGAITALGLISSWSHYPLVVAPFGASTVLLFGHPSSPLAEPRNIVLGNTVAALFSVVCVALWGHAPWVMGLAVGLTIALGQLLRCLHPPAGADARAQRLTAVDADGRGVQPPPARRGALSPPLVLIA